MGKERAQLERVVNGIRSLSRGLDDARELLDLGESEGDEATVAGVDADTTAIAAKVASAKPMVARRIIRSVPTRAEIVAENCEATKKPTALTAKASENCVAVSPKLPM